MPNELEAKLKVASLSPVRRALRAAGAEHIETVLQTDLYFDTPGAELRRSDCALRIRRCRHLRGKGKGESGGACVTFKGSRAPHRRIKVRREVQTHVEDGDALAEVFGACGLKPVMKVQKRRASYRLGRCRIELDELPLIGCFVEVEGPSERAIAAARRKLSLEGRPILRPYVELLAEHCRKNRLPCREIVFDE